MEKFTALTARACPLDQANLNTDQILPARYLKWTRAMGLGDALFRDLRFDSDNNENSDFPLNRPVWREARIIVAGRNFGCGSSREAAVYALYDYGIRCVIAPSFGDIFAANAAQNGLLAAVLTDDETNDILRTLDANPEVSVTVDLERQAVVCDGRTYRFAIDPVRRMRLLNGWDDIDLTAAYRDRIAAFKADDARKRPWAVPRAPS